MNCSILTISREQDASFSPFFFVLSIFICNFAAMQRWLADKIPSRAALNILTNSNIRLSLWCSRNKPRKLRIWIETTSMMVGCGVYTCVRNKRPILVQRQKMFAPSNGCRHNSYTRMGSKYSQACTPEHHKKALAPSFYACVSEADVIYCLKCQMIVGWLLLTIIWHTLL